MVTLSGRVAERGADPEPRLSNVRGPDIVQWKSMRGGFNTRDVNFGQLFDVSKDTAELIRKTGLFLGRECESRQLRDAVDIKFGGLRHDHLRMLKPVA